MLESTSFTNNEAMYENLLNYKIEFPEPNASEANARKYMLEYCNMSIHIVDQIIKISKIHLTDMPTVAQFGKLLAGVVESELHPIPINLEKLSKVDPNATQQDVLELDCIVIPPSIQPYMLRVSMAIMAYLHITIPDQALIVDYKGIIPNAPGFFMIKTKRLVVPLQMVESFPRTLTSGYNLAQYIELILNKAISFLHGHIEDIEIKEHELVPRFPPFLVEYADRHPGIFPKETPKVDIPAQDPTKPHLIELPPSPLKITFELDESKVKETWEDFQTNFEPRAKEITDLVAPSFRDIFTINIAAAEIAHLLKLTPNHVQAESIDAALTYIIYKTTPELQWIISLNRFDQTKPTLAKLNRAHCTVGDTNRLLSLIASGSNAEELLIQYFRAIPAYLQGTSPSINLPDIFEAQPTIT
ncbi:MAG: hypothetical protein ACKVQS_07940 [Fimbriimonadaceae bacterium]